MDEAARAVLRALAAAPGESDLDGVAWRVAAGVAEAEPAPMRSARAEGFARSMRAGVFLPSLPVLMNAGRGGPLAACYVLEPRDSLDSIYEALARAARIQQGSGGAGIHLSRLRPRGSPIAGSGGHSPGPVAFVTLFARSAQVNALSGRRAGAHLAVLRDDHPDVVEFVRARLEHPAELQGVGLALGTGGALLDEARRGAAHALRDARGATVGRVAARELLEAIAGSIRETGEPTLLFLDRIAEGNPLPGLGRIEAANPCGEQPLLPGESCVLGSLHLPALADARGVLDAERLREATTEAVRFLDDLIDVAVHPDDAIAAATLRTRKIGLGVMGFADLLLLRGVRYGSEDSRRIAGEVMGAVADAALAADRALAEERGAFPAFGPQASGAPRRNATLLAVAPTGTLRLLAGCSGGIEPLLHPVVRVRTPEACLRWTDRHVAGWLAEHGEAPEETLDALAAGTPSARLPGLADEERALLRRGAEVPAEEQLALQAAFQAHVDGAVSKTVHLPSGTAPQRITSLVELAHRLGCKGAAFYCGGGAEAPLIELTERPCLDCAT